jgi:RNA polymerase sigma-70 factor (ECF subfamily)
VDAVAAVSDLELVSRVARRDESALGLLYDRYGSAALALAVRVLGDRAEGEDVVQEAFVRVWEDASGYREDRGSVAAWLVTSVRNRAIDRLRRRGARERATERAAAERPLATGPLELPDEDSAPRIRAALRELPPDQRETIELAYFQGLTQTELSARLGQPLGTIKSRIRLGMKKLREAMTGRVTP